MKATSVVSFIACTFNLPFCLVQNKLGSWKITVGCYKPNHVVTMMLSAVSIDISHKNKSI